MAQKQILQPYTDTIMDSVAEEATYRTSRTSPIPTLSLSIVPDLPEKALSLNLAKIELLLVESPYKQLNPRQCRVLQNVKLFE